MKAQSRDPLKPLCNFYPDNSNIVQSGLRRESPTVDSPDPTARRVSKAKG